MDTNSDVSPAPTKAKRPSWVTPTRFLIALLAIEVTLYASEQYQWFAFNRHKNWTVLITIAVATAGLLLMVGWFGIRIALRRTVQFDLAAILMLIVTIAIPCGWFVDARQRVENERLAMAWIEDRDGGKYYRLGGCEVSSGANFSWRACEGYCGPACRTRWLREWLGDEFFATGICHVEIGDRFPCDKSYDDVSERRKSHFDYFDEKHDLSNRELVYVSHFYDLEQLGICSRKVTDAGLPFIYGMRRLKKLSLVTPNVSPEAIAKLRRHFPHCEIVQYEDFDISDFDLALGDD